MIRTEALSKQFGKLIAIDKLTLNVAAGEIFGLVGPDGAGKSTTLRLLASILDPTSGEAFVAGCHTVREAEAVKARIGYMSQRFGLYEDLTVAENIRFYADLFSLSKKEREERMERLLHFSRLTPFTKRLAGKLSGGMKQKLGLVCTLLHTPEVLLLDEPTAGVDPVSRREFWEMLHLLQQERVTIIFSTSYLDEAERCSRVGLIHKGKLLACDTPSALKKEFQGTILSVQTSKPKEDVLLLEKAFSEEAVALFGSHIHVRTEEPATVIQKIIPGCKVTVIAPSLEDLFIQKVQNG